MTKSTISFVLFSILLFVFSGHTSGQLFDLKNKKGFNPEEQTQIEQQNIPPFSERVESEFRAAAGLTPFNQKNSSSKNTTTSTNLPIDSVALSPDYYDKTYILSYMDISVFFSKEIAAIEGKFYMAPEGVTIASTKEVAHTSLSDFQYQTGQSDYLYYCNEIEIRNNNEVFIPYKNYFSLYDHHLKYNTKYNLLFVGKITFSDGSKYTNTESDVLASFNTAPIPNNYRIKDKGTFELADIPNLGFSKAHLEDPTTDRYIKATYAKKAIHNLTPLTDENLTGNDVNVAIVDTHIFENSLVNKAVVYRSYPLEDEMFIDKDLIAPLTENIDSILPLLNHGTHMARFMLNYAPKINIYSFHKTGLIEYIFPNGGIKDVIMNPANAIDIASFSGSEDAIEELAEGVQNGLIVSRAIGNDRAFKNTFDNYQHKDVLLPHYSSFLTGDNKATIKGAYVTVQAALFSRCRPSKGPEDICLNMASCIRSEAGDARYYTLTIAENGNGATSEATATFSGMVALLLEANKKYERNLTPRQVVEIMFQTAVDLGEAGVDSIFGHGSPDLGAALEIIRNDLPITFSLYEVMEPDTIQTAVPDILENTFDFSVYPNPTSNKISIRLNRKVNGPVTFKLFNILGKELLCERINADVNIVNMDLEHLPLGVYIVNSYFDNGNVISRKVMKK